MIGKNTLIQWFRIRIEKRQKADVFKSIDYVSCSYSCSFKIPFPLFVFIVGEVKRFGFPRFFNPLSFINGLKLGQTFHGKNNLL